MGSEIKLKGSSLQTSLTFQQGYAVSDYEKLWTLCKVFLDTTSAV